MVFLEVFTKVMKPGSESVLVWVEQVGVDTCGVAVLGVGGKDVSDEECSTVGIVVVCSSYIDVELSSTRGRFRGVEFFEEVLTAVTVGRGHVEEFLVEEFRPLSLSLFGKDTRAAKFVLEFRGWGRSLEGRG